MNNAYFSKKDVFSYISRDDCFKELSSMVSESIESLKNDLKDGSIERSVFSKNPGYGILYSDVPEDWASLMIDGFVNISIDTRLGGVSERFTVFLLEKQEIELLETKEKESVDIHFVYDEGYVQKFCNKYITKLVGFDVEKRFRGSGRTHIIWQSKSSKKWGNAGSRESLSTRLCNKSLDLGQVQALIVEACVGGESSAKPGKIEGETPSIVITGPAVWEFITKIPSFYNDVVIPGWIYARPAMRDIRSLIIRSKEKLASLIRDRYTDSSGKINFVKMYNDKHKKYKK